MCRNNILTIWIFLWWIHIHPVSAQNLFFRHIGSDQGMKGLGSHYCATDQFGFIWVGTSEGLVKYNGKEITYFLRQTHPALPEDAITYVFCDSQNRIWVCGETRGMACIGQNGQMVRQQFSGGNQDVSVDLCFEDGDGRMYANTSVGMYALVDHDQWTPAPWLDSLIGDHRINQIRKFDNNRFLVVLSGIGVKLINMKTKSVETFISVPGTTCATRFDDKSILIGAGKYFSLTRVYLDQPDRLFNMALPPGFQKNNQYEKIHSIVRAADHKVYISTASQGLLCLDSSLTHYTQYLHDPVNPLSILSNTPRYITADSSGIIMMTSSDGVNYTNVHSTAVEYINYLKTAEGKLIHTSVLSITEDHRKDLWICTREGVYIHHRENKSTSQVYFPLSAGFRSDEVYPFCIERDQEDRIWIGCVNEGIAVFNRDGDLDHVIRMKDAPDYAGYLANPRVIRRGEDGFMYVGSEQGLFRINPKNFGLDTFAQEQNMGPILRKRIIDILPVKDGIWVSASPSGAAYSYSFTDKKLKVFDTGKGLLSRRVYGLTADTRGYIYVGSYAGLSIINPHDSIVNFEKGNGLISSRIESIETADDGSVWMTNNYNILKYDPLNGEMSSLGGRQGFMNVNFGIMSSTKLSSGEIVFGTNKGLIIIDPSKMQFDKKPLKVFVFYRDAHGNETRAETGTELKFDYRQQNIPFTFAVNDMMVADQVLYKYRLARDQSGTWTAPSLNSDIDFNLGPGSYRLDVEAYDGNDWYPLDTPVRFSISLPWWRQWWFLTSVFLSAFFVGLLYFRSRIEKYRKEISITRQIADLESKALRAQMNPHFVFNSLNAIQECIVTGKVDEAYTYLSKFSRLLRMVLDHSDKAEIILQEELEVLELYITLEKLRFKEDMLFHVQLDEDLDTEEVRIPPMLIQPHLENALWHGLRHKTGYKDLRLSITESLPGYLEVIIEDNGIGRKQASLIKLSSITSDHHKSKGKLLSENRMELLRMTYPKTHMDITDLYDDQGEAAGTRVTLLFPIL